MSDKAPVKVSVVVDDAHREKMRDVVRDLKKKGFVLEQTHQEIGVLSGTVAQGSVGKLSSVRGVSAVQEDRDDYRTQE